MTILTKKVQNNDIVNEFASKAFLMNTPMSPRKVALMIDEIRMKSVAHARQILAFSKKKSATLLLKLLNSAVANAVNNNHYDKTDVEKLLIANIWVGKGMVLKRIETRARGSSNRRLSRYSNVYMYLKEKELLTITHKEKKTIDQTSAKTENKKDKIKKTTTISEKKVLVKEVK